MPPKKEPRVKIECSTWQRNIAGNVARRRSAAKGVMGGLPQESESSMHRVP